MINMDNEEYYNKRLSRLEERLSDIEKQLSDYVEEKANTTETPAWGSIPHNKDNHPSKSDFIILRGDNWSDWKLPYKYKGKIHCGGVRAASAAAGGARQTGGKMSLTSEERGRLNSARSACGIED